MHEGGFGIEAASDGGFAFTRPDGTPIPDAGQRRFRGSAAGAERRGSKRERADGEQADDELPLFALNRKARLEIDTEGLIAP